MEIRNKKIIITGGKGMLGSAFKELLQKQKAIVYAFDSVELDICKEANILYKIQLIKPDIFINCAGYTDVDKSEMEPKAMEINGHSLKYISRICSELKIKLIHFSTDYIYSGTFSEPISEIEQPRPINKYGESKLCGDNHVLTTPDLDFLLFRIQWIYGNNGNNFVDRMLTLSRQKNELQVVDDQLGRPTSAIFVTKVVIECLENNLSGLYNIGPKNLCSWFEFASYILKNLNSKISPIPTTAYPTVAKRPLYSVLSLNKIQLALAKSNVLNQTWQELVDEYLDR